MLKHQLMVHVGEARATQLHLELPKLPQLSVGGQNLWWGPQVPRPLAVPMWYEEGGNLRQQIIHPAQPELLACLTSVP